MIRSKCFINITGLVIVCWIAASNAARTSHETLPAFWSSSYTTPYFASALIPRPTFCSSSNAITQITVRILTSPQTLSAITASKNITHCSLRTAQAYYNRFLLCTRLNMCRQCNNDYKCLSPKDARGIPLICKFIDGGPQLHEVGGNREEHRQRLRERHGMWWHYCRRARVKPDFHQNPKPCNQTDHYAPPLIVSRPYCCSHDCCLMQMRGENQQRDELMRKMVRLQLPVYRDRGIAPDAARARMHGGHLMELWRQCEALDREIQSGHEWERKPRGDDSPRVGDREGPDALWKAMGRGAPLGQPATRLPDVWRG